MNNLKFLFLSLLTLIVGSSLAACSSSSDDNGGGGGGVTFNVLQADLQVANTATSATFSVVAGGQPTVTVTSGSDWCSVNATPTVSGNSYTYTVNVTANTTSEARTATIRVKYGTSIKNVTVTQPAKSAVVVPDAGMTHNAKELAALMYAGINIGNTMECSSGEGAWSGAKVNEDYIKGLKAAGFNAVRIPCAWDSHMTDKTKYTIDATWLNRVYEVVSWCIANDMYVVLNAHWDGGWLEDNIFDSSKEDAIVAEQKAIWTQVANKMNSFDEHLLFAACNEPGMNETSGGSKSWKNNADAVARVVKYEQTMIDAVRATGGNNATRTVIVQGLGTDITNTNDYMTTLPTDAVKDRMMVEVHYYEPYQFCLMEEDAGWGKMFYYWGKDNHVDGSEHNATWGEEDWVKSQFAKLAAKYTSKGIPCIIGEYSAMFRSITGDGESQEMHDKSVAYYGEIVTEYAKNAGCVPFYWETNAVINRTTGAVKKQDVIDGIMKGAAAGKYPW